MFKKIMKVFVAIFFVGTVGAKEITRDDFNLTRPFVSCAKSLVDSSAGPKKLADNESEVLKRHFEDMYLENRYKNGFVDFADAQAYQSAKAAGFMTHAYLNVSFPGEQNGQRGIFKQTSLTNGFVFVPLPKDSGEVVEFSEDIILEKDYDGKVLQSEKLQKKYERFDLSDVEYQVKLEGELVNRKLFGPKDKHPIVNFPVGSWSEPYETRVAPTFNCFKAPCGQSQAMMKLTKRPWTHKGILKLDNVDSPNGIKAKRPKVNAVAAQPEALSKALSYALDDFAETYVSQCTNTALVTSGLNFMDKRKGFPENYNDKRALNLNPENNRPEACIEKLKTCQQIEDERVRSTVASVISKIKQVEDNKKPSFSVGQNLSSRGLNPEFEQSVDQSTRGSLDEFLDSESFKGLFDESESSAIGR